MKIAFAGTQNFSKDVLCGLLKALPNDVHLDFTLTQPPRKRGRGQSLRHSDVYNFSVSNGIRVFTLEKSSQLSEDLEYCLEQIDYLIVVSFGLIFSTKLLSLPTNGCLNIHPSILPRWRGAAPIQRAIEAGDKETGVCLMKMNIELDSGPVWGKRILPIKPLDSTFSLSNSLARESVELLKAFFKSSRNLQKVKFYDQENVGISYAKKITVSDTKLIWDKPIREITDKIRAFSPDPGVFTFLCNQRIKLCSAEILEKRITTEHPGTVIELPNGNNKILKIACKDGVLGVHRLQRAGGKWSDAKIFFNGFRIKLGDLFS